VAKNACDFVATSLDGNSDTVTVRDLPSVLRGVYFLRGEGMPYCLEITHGIDSRRVREDNGDVLFRWDGESETVKR
jgi:hypothetical protein